MRAVNQLGYGDPHKVLRLDEVERPTPTDGQVLVRVVAASINAIDWRTVYAQPILVRLLGGLRRPGDSRQMGHDLAGVVEAVGPGRTDLAPGDEVYGNCSGGLAEYVVGQDFVRKPANLTFEQAAAVPVAGRTALQAVHKHGQVEPGQRVVVIGAGGGVGTFAVQIAAALGADVTAVTSTDKVELMGSIGAARVIDYTTQDFTRMGDRYDVIVDVAGNYSIRAMRRVLADGGRIVLAAAGRGWFGMIGRLAGSTIRRKIGQPVIFFISSGPREEQLATLRDMIEAGKITPVIDRTYPLDQAADAISYVATEKARGKVVIKVADG